MIYLTLFLEFFKIGALTFGGGYAMIPFIQETVLKHNWMSMKDLVDFIAVSESTPGAFAVNISTYIGSETGGFLGSLCATLGLVLPPFVIIIIIAKCYQKFKESLIVNGLLFGLKSTVVGLISATVLSVAIEIFFENGFTKSVFTNVNFYFSIFVFLFMLFLLLYKKFNPTLIIVISAALGIIAGYTGIIKI